MFVQISPLEQDLGETLSSLNFATRVRGVELGPARKQIDVVELQKLKMMVRYGFSIGMLLSLTVMIPACTHTANFLYQIIEKPVLNVIFLFCLFPFFPLILMKLDKAKQELRSKDNALWKLEENLRNFEGKAKGKDQICRIQQEKLSELEGHIVLKTQLCRQLEKQLLQLSEGANGKEETCLRLQQKVAVQMNYVGLICFSFVVGNLKYVI